MFNQNNINLNLSVKKEEQGATMENVFNNAIMGSEHKEIIPPDLCSSKIV